MARAMPMEVAAGESLQTRLDGGERLDQQQLLALLAALGEELGEAHRAGRFHGTITPADIRFDAAGEVTLGGWGRDTTPDPVHASRYAPIECYAPVHPQGPWTDVYALAAVLWRAITGGPPAEVLHRKGDVTLARLAPPGFDPHFLRMVDAALEIAPQRRPQDIDRWLAMFRPARPSAIPAAATQGRPEPSPGAPARRSFPAATVAAAALVAAAAAGALWLAPASDPPAPSPERARPIAAAVPPRPTASVAKPTLPAGLAIAVPVVAAPAAAPVATPAAVAALKPVAKPPRVAKAEVAKAEPAEPAPADPAPEAATAVAEAAVGQAPRTLLVRADKHLRELFGDYARLRARVERSYDDPDVPYAAKQRAYREGLRIQEELVKLRAARERIARTSSVRAANRRYDELEVRAGELDARMKALRNSI